MRFAVCTALAATLFAAAAPAFAQAPPPPPGVASVGDEAVYLRDGGMLRGTIIEIITDDHVTISLANGQTARVDWSLVARIERREKAPGAGAPGTAPPAKTAVVHIESERSVRLEALSGEKSYSFVCTSPCDKAVDLGAQYRIAGDGVRTSRAFSIEGQQGQRIVIEVDPGSKAAFVGGIVLVSLSPVVSIVGLLIWALNSVDGSEGGRTVGIGIALGGLLGLTGGIIMIATNASTKQTQSAAAPAPHAAAVPRPFFAELPAPFSSPAPILFTAPAVRF
jgi:hypothetical protein